MAFNLVDLVRDQFGEQILGQVSNTLGTDASQTSTAVGGALPTILKSLLSSADSSSGAASVYDTVQHQDDSVLDNLGDALSGDANSLIANGSKTLGSLLGDDTLAKLAAAVASYSGIDKNSAGSLLGLAAPIIFGVIKRKVMGEGLDAGGLAAMLSGQKDNIKAAMPPQLAALIEPPETESDETITIERKPIPKPEPTPAVAATNAKAPQAKTQQSRSMWSKILPLVAIAVVVLLALNMCGGGDDAADTSSLQVPDAPAVAALDMGKQIGDVLGTATSTLNSITDVESAQAALPDIEAMNKARQRNRYA